MRITSSDNNEFNQLISNWVNNNIGEHVNFLVLGQGDIEVWDKNEGKSDPSEWCGSAEELIDFLRKLDYNYEIYSFCRIGFRISQVNN